MGGYGRGALVPLPSRIHREVDNIASLLQTVHSSGFYPVASFIAYSLSSKGDVLGIGRNSPMVFPHQFSAGQMYDVSERRLMSARRDSAGSTIPGKEVDSFRTIR